MCKAGQQPEKGKYKCKNCGKVIYIDEVFEALPPCPNCNQLEYKKLSE